MSRKQKQVAESPGFIARRLQEGLMLVLLAISLFLLLALFTYHSTDPSWSHLIDATGVDNAAGRVGAWLSDILLYLCGYLAYIIPLLLVYSTWLLYAEKDTSFFEEREPVYLLACSLKTLGFILTITAGGGLISFNGRLMSEHSSFFAGGIIGNAIANFTINIFNFAGSCVILTTFLLIGLTLFTGLSWVDLIEQIGRVALSICQRIGQKTASIRWSDLFQRKKIVSKPKIEPKLSEKPKPKPKLKSKLSLKLKSKPKMIESEEISKEMRRAPRYSNSDALPSLSLLDPPRNDQKHQLNDQELAFQSKQVESHLADFGVVVEVVGIQPGPVVTRFELQLAAGTKVSKISNLSKDLARSMSVISVRVVEVIPGKSVIGIELPNPHREMVGLQDILASKAYGNARSALTLALGKDIGGHPVVVDLAKMPHLLVAGTTGSGKSVSLNTMLLSLLYKATPQQLRMIMIDPKMLELSVYDGIPHLLTPVVTDMRDAASALRWCVVEMERRYRLMSALGVRNIAGYNAKVREAIQKGAPLLDPLSIPDEEEQKTLQELPQIVVLADEFADMMVVVGKKVETLIARLAQKARAAGVHLILATQRPSVDVITGLIKANIPTRIAFQVSSKIDSRTILDQQGAEQLLGNGDMLYLAPGTGVPTRVHGAYVSDDEVHRVVADLKEKAKPEYIDDILTDTGSADAYTDSMNAEKEGSQDGEQDSHYDQAVAWVAKTRRVSISSIQRYFKIGYNRAARIVEAMEAAGVVSKAENSGSREVLVPAVKE